jgi:hypothetical protein
MAHQTYHKGKWKAEVDAEEFSSGKFQGVVLLFHEGEPAPKHQIEHRVTEISDTFEGALQEAKVLAHHLLGNL